MTVLPVTPVDALKNGALFVTPGMDIQSVIDRAAGTKQVVILPGTYELSTALIFRGGHPKLHLSAAVPGTVTLTLNDSSTYFSAASRNMLYNEVPTQKLLQTGITTAYPPGTTQVTVSSAAGLAVGDLFEIRRATVATGTLGEIRKIIAISGNTVTLDYPIYTDSLDGTSTRIDVLVPRSATIQGITFDLTNHDAGHGGIQFINLMDVRIEDCRFVTGGQHGAYVMGSHTVRYLRCHAEDMDVRDIDWTPERTGEAMIPAGRSIDVAGEGYGLAFEATDGWAIDCTFRRCRHHISAAGAFYHSTNLTYQGCRGTEDLQGAYDMHHNVNYGRIVDCHASRGWAGAWIRGAHITVADCQFSDEESDGIRLLETPDYITAQGNRMQSCGYGIRVATDSGGTRRAIWLSDNQIIGAQDNAFFTTAGQTYVDMRIMRNLIRDGHVTSVLQGSFDGLLVAGNRWDGLQDYGAGQSPNLIHLQPDNATGAAKNIRITDNDFQPEGASGTNDIGYCIRLGRAAAAASLADGTYQDLIVERNMLRTAVASFSPMITLDANGGGTRATVTGIESIVDNRRNGNPASSQTRSQGSTSVADGGTITHTLARTPTRVQLTGSVAGQIVTRSATSATTITVAIKKADGTAGATQTVDWRAEVA